METRTYTVYKYDELPEDSKEKARIENRDINTDYDWWNFSYQDAKTIGLEIESFDLYRREIDGGVMENGITTAKLILENHGESCETYKLAETFLKKARELESKAETRETEEAMEELESEFEHALLKEYLHMLEQEGDYLESEEAIVETFRANDYDFTLDGKIA